MTFKDLIARADASNQAAREIAEWNARFVADIGNCMICTLQNEAGDHEDFCPVGKYMRLRGDAEGEKR